MEISFFIEIVFAVVPGSQFVLDEVLYCLRRFFLSSFFFFIGSLFFYFNLDRLDPLNLGGMMDLTKS